MNHRLTRGRLLLVSLATLAVVGCDSPTIEDGGMSDAAAIDAGSPDGGPVDAAMLDGALPDSGTDAGELDAHVIADLDGGELDAGESDAGESDAGESDAGIDAAAADAGRDAGSDAGSDAGRGCVVPTDYATITQALAARTCSVIDVRDGTYAENLTITRNVTIRGAGAAVFLDGSAAGSTVVVQTGRVATLETLTVRNGRANMGGGIRNAGTLSLNDVVVTDNVAIGINPSGAGIHNTGTLTLLRTRVEQNAIDITTSEARGGGISSIGGTVSLLAGTVVQQNTVHVISPSPNPAGGGIALDGGAVLISRGAVIALNEVIGDGPAGGSQPLGGGVWARGGSVELRSESRVSGNIARGERATGGGVAITGATLTVDASHITGNTTLGKRIMGGGLSSTLPSTITLSGGSDVSGNHLVAPSGAANPVAEGGGVFMSEGSLAVDDSSIRDNTISFPDYTNLGITRGGGLSLIAGVTTTLVRCDVTGNQVTVNGTSSGTASQHEGGGVYVENGTISLMDVEIASNQAILNAPASSSCRGGGLSAHGVMVSGTGVTVTGNECSLVTAGSGTATATGGGLHASYGSMVLSDCTVSGNRAAASGGLNASALGGGLALRGWYAVSVLGTLSLTRCTVSGNEVRGSHLSSGAGVMVDGTNSPANVQIDQCTLSGNTAATGTRLGGGLRLLGSAIGSVTATVSSSTFTGNTADLGGGLSVDSNATCTMQNSILYGNVASMGPECITSSSNLNSLGYNLFGSLSACTVSGTRTGDRVGMDPLLGPLADNGGPTFTHVIGATGAAREAGNPAGCTDSEGVAFTTDQRGLPRVVGRCDMGSVELAP